MSDLLGLPCVHGVDATLCGVCTNQDPEADYDHLLSEHRHLVAEVERLRRQQRDRMMATVYERAAWQHDIGEHDGSDLPYAFCPRCELEHPLGQVARLRAELRRVSRWRAAWKGLAHYQAEVIEEHRRRRCGVSP